VGGDVTLKGYRLAQGRLVLELLQHVGDVTVNDMIAATASVGSEIKQAIELLRHLGGKPPSPWTRIRQQGGSSKQSRQCRGVQQLDRQFSHQG
jgi:alkylated DNA nucleotide flippase Atl1